MSVPIHQGQISIKGKAGFLKAGVCLTRIRLPAMAFALAITLLAACATHLPVPESGDGSLAMQQTAAQRSPKADLLYDLLVGEIAGQRGAVNISAENYLRAARLSGDPQIAERAAKIAVFAGDDKKALEAARKWVTLAPEDAEAQQVVAIMYLRNGQVEKAIPYLQRIRQSNAHQPYKGFMFVARLLSREKNKETALQAMSRLVERYPEEAEAQFAYAHLAMQARQYAKAHKLLDKVISLRPDRADAYVLRANLYRAEGDIESASKAYRQAIRLNPGNLETSLSYARMLVEARRFQQAREAFKQLEARAPDNADVLFALGLLALQAEQNEEAKRYFSMLIEKGQRVEDASFFIGRIAETETDNPEALRWYRKVTSGVNHAEARIRIAVLTARQGDLEAARQILHELAQDDPRHEVRALLVEGDILRRSGQNSEAFEVLGRGLEKYPDNPQLLYAQALTAERIDRLDVLEQNLNRMLKADPDNAQALNALGYTLADRTHRYEEAYRYVKRALEIEPDDAAILDSMGWVLYRLGRYSESIGYLRRALKRTRDGDPEIAAHLGEVLWVSGDRDAARKVWEQALKQFPDDEKLRNTVERHLK